MRGGNISIMYVVDEWSTGPRRMEYTTLHQSGQEIRSEIDVRGNGRDKGHVYCTFKGLSVITLPPRLSPTCYLEWAGNGKMDRWWVLLYVTFEFGKRLLCAQITPSLPIGLSTKVFYLFVFCSIHPCCHAATSLSPACPFFSSGKLVIVPNA